MSRCDTFALEACREGNVEKLQLLTDKYGLEYLEKKNSIGKTALHEAVIYSQLKCVEYLLEMKSDVNALKRGDWTPLMLACTKPNLKIVQTLVEHGSKLHLVNKDGWNCLHIAVRENNREIVEYLLDIDVNLGLQRTKNKRTPLHTAALHGHMEMVDVLLNRCSYGEEEEVVDCCGTTPFMDALRNDHVHVAQLLVLKQKPNIFHEDYIGGRTCIHTCAQAGACRSLLFLLHHFVHLQFTQLLQFSCLQPFEYHQQQNLLQSYFQQKLENGQFLENQFLSRQIIDVINSIFVDCCDSMQCNIQECSFIPCVNLLIYKRINAVNNKNNNNKLENNNNNNNTNAIIEEKFASSFKNNNYKKSLFNVENFIEADAGRNIVSYRNNKTCETINKTTSVELATELNKGEKLMNPPNELLDSLVAYINSMSSIFKDTPLHLAVKEGQLKMVHLLLVLGANVDICDSHGRTSLDMVDQMDKESTNIMFEIMEIFK